VLADGGGALGRHIADDLAGRGHDIVILTRRPDPAAATRQVVWDGETVSDWAAELDGPHTALINLAGKPVDCRPTKRNIDELTRSRVLPTRALVQAGKQLKTPLTHWIQESMTAIWSDAGETRCNETTLIPVGLPQMTGVATAAEEALFGANTYHRVILRTSELLEPQAPTLARLIRLTELGLGGRIGSGQQWFSWIHLADWLAIIRACLGLTPDVLVPDGVLVAATDNPVRNHDLMAALRSQLHRRDAPPTPAMLLKLAAVLARTDSALALTGRHATSKVLGAIGFQFQFPTLEPALADVLASFGPGVTR
jgi:uncharacterized protein